MPNTFEKIDKCMVCDGDVSIAVELSATPPANELLDIDVQDKELYDLNLMSCNKCKHLQIDTEISKFRLFKYYTFTSTTSSSNYNYFRSYATEMKERYKPKFVVDIGSNDGLFLSFFKDKNCLVMVVDPAENIVAIAKKNGINTWNNFFSEMIALKIKLQNGTADLITANNVFAHNRNLLEIMKGVKLLLSEKGTFIFEVAYAKKMLENNTIDLIYHEHIHHWNLKPALKYMRKFGLRVYDAEITNTHGGSIRIYVEHEENFTDQSERLNKLLKEEDNIDDLVKSFSEFAIENRKNMIALLKNLKLQNKTVSILGYPAKACTLSYYFGLDKTLITEIFDDNVLKIGKYSHKGFKISPSTNIYKNKPDYLLVLSWNYMDELMKKHELYTKTGGKFILPFPARVI